MAKAQSTPVVEVVSESVVIGENITVAETETPVVTEVVLDNGTTITHY